MSKLTSLPAPLPLVRLVLLICLSLLASHWTPLGSYRLTADDQPLTPAESAAQMQLPPGFQATLFAGEPDVVRPIAFAIDDRGRLWVVESESYPEWITSGTGKDRVSIFTDTDNDGQFDRKQTFLENGTNLSGIQVGFGGVWLNATPNFIFIPDRDGDDKPDGPAEILLDGWDLKSKHNVTNGLTWGPDGWLYAGNGILGSETLVGKPGTKDSERVPMNCGVWRYHPVHHKFEVVAHGMTNPWGLDFDQYGRLFATNCVVEHLWHIIPGGNYERMHGTGYNPYTYQLMKSCTDHIHWGGGRWQSSRDGQGIHDAPGGGHAHAGAMIYLGDNWPDKYRGRLFTCNLHGRRVNQDYFEIAGSGVVARHGPDFLFAADPWFRGLEMKYGPDGGVYLTDWHDTGECHHRLDPQKTTGRIFKITYGDVQFAPIDLAAMTDAQLIGFHKHPNRFFIRHALRLLHERAVAGTLDANTLSLLLAMFQEAEGERDRLTALWALHLTNGLNTHTTLGLSDPHAHVRAWAVRLHSGVGRIAPVDRLARLAQSDDSPVVRLALASVLQRLPLEDRFEIAKTLVAHADDATDANLPLLLWYGIEPLAETRSATELVKAAEIPQIRQYITRRMGEAAGSDRPGRAALDALTDLAMSLQEPDAVRDVLQGYYAAIAGRRRLPLPDRWSDLFDRIQAGTDEVAKEQAILISLIFDDERAISHLYDTIADTSAPAQRRQTAIRALAQKQHPRLAKVLQRLVSRAGDVRSAALQTLAAYDDRATPEVIVRHYHQFSEIEKDDAVTTLCSRKAYVASLLRAVKRGQIPSSDISTYAARQILAFQDERLQQQLSQVWGTIRDTNASKAKLIERYVALANQTQIAQADKQQGRVLFQKTCANCHKLFGEGGTVGPDLTGSQRKTVRYVVENLVDPNQLVGRAYQMTIVVTDDGRVLSGIVKQETARAMTLQTANEELIIPLDEIDERRKSPLSLMPEGILDRLSDEQVRDLIAFLSQ